MVVLSRESSEGKVKGGEARMPATPLPKRDLTESDIADPEQAMRKHLAELDSRMAEQHQLGAAQIKEANGAVARLKQSANGSSKFSLKEFQDPNEECWELGEVEGQLPPCPHQPTCARYERARKLLES